MSVGIAEVDERDLKEGEKGVEITLRWSAEWTRGAMQQQ